MENNKFQDMKTTAKGEDRAFVNLESLSTLWFNTGTLCNLQCANCYIESSPTNDRLVYISANEVENYINEIKSRNDKTELIGLTGGEPFLNPEIINILKAILDNDHDVLVLTNANRVIKRHQKNLLQLKNKFGDKLHLRISLDHFSEDVHDKERGSGAFDKTMKELKWLFDNGFNISIASRSLMNETTDDSILGHEKILREHEIDLDLREKLVVFPEMKSGKDLPEITTNCWNILDKKPEDQMCASERMIIKRKGDDSPVIMPCTLLAYDEQFILGKTLKEADSKVYLNHPFCAEFCVLGGASCSSTK